ncbi:MAG: sulfite exporter TauE/SafE family protein, partial [Planctomycetota bacterium]
AGLAPAAAALAGVTLILSGVILVAKSLGLGLPSRAMDPGLARLWLRRVQARALRMPRASRALTIGATTALLPCGWLYAFFVLAAGTGSAAGGALVMLAFWLGTVPILTALGLGTAGLKQRFGPTLQVATSLALIAFGAWTLAGRTTLDAHGLAARASAGEQHACCSGGADGPAADTGRSPIAPEGAKPR